MPSDSCPESDDALLAAILRTFASHQEDYVSCLDRNRRMLFLSRVASRDLSDVIGRPMEEFLAPEHRASVIERAFASGELQTLAYEAVLADGTTRSLRTQLIPFAGPKNEPLVLQITSDETERCRLAEELQQSEEFKKLLVENLPDFVMLLDQQRRIIWINRLALGFDLNDVLGKTPADFLSATFATVAMAAIDAAFAQATVQEYETEVQRNGASVWHQTRAVPVGSLGAVRNVLLLSTDITARKRAEEAMRVSEERLRSAQRLESVGQLAGGIAHDFNNLLQVIVGNLHFAQKAMSSGTDASEALEQINVATERAAELTEQLLTIGRRKRVEPKRVELGALVARSTRMLRRVIPESIQLVCESPKEPCCVKVDPAQFDQVLINLCVNARDAMVDGGVLTIRVRPESDEQVAVSVTDTGTGIADQDLPHLFEPFFTTKTMGSGLGLAVVAGIVDAHGGELVAESQPGRGSSFTIRLPRIESIQEPDQALETKIHGGTELILVAEDEKLVRKQTVRVLEAAGYSVLQAEDGAQAIELARQHQGKIALVLLDVMMPRVDGWTAHLEIIKSCPDSKALFATGYAANALPEDYATGGARLLRKPYKPHQLLAHVRAVLDGTQPE